MSDATSPLKGMHAVVTGAGRGIGAAIATELARQGATMTLMGRDARRLAAKAEELGSQVAVHTVSFDVSDAESVRAGFDNAEARHGAVHILVNNAGDATSAPFTRTGMELWSRMLDVNLTGTYLCCSRVIPGMLENRFGRVVNIASTAGLTGYPYVTAYCAAKHGVVGLTRALALEVAAHGITVNAVCPGYTDTDLVGQAVDNIVRKTGKTQAQARAALIQRNPQGRMMQPAEIANAVLWLCLPGSEGMTGQAIAVAGGEVL